MGTLSHKSILVVDDDTAMRRALDKVLRQEGGLVTAARSGVEALEQLANRENRFDLVITDLRMPLGDGKLVLDVAKAERPELPVMIISAYAGPDTKAEFLMRGAAAFLEKPLDTAKLLWEMARVMAAGRTK